MAVAPIANFARPDLGRTTYVKAEVIELVSAMWNSNRYQGLEGLYSYDSLFFIRCAT